MCATWTYNVMGCLIGLVESCGVDPRGTTATLAVLFSGPSARKQFSTRRPEEQEAILLMASQITTEDGSFRSSLDTRQVRPLKAHGLRLADGGQR